MSLARAPTVSGVSVATLLKPKGMRARLAASAKIHSACGRMSPVRPTGAMPKGALYSGPNKVVLKFGSNSQSINCGLSVMSANALTLRSTPCSAPVPLVRYSHVKNGMRLRARRSRSELDGYLSSRSGSAGIMVQQLAKLPAFLGSSRADVQSRRCDGFDCGLECAVKPVPPQRLGADLIDS